MGICHTKQFLKLSEILFKIQEPYRQGKSKQKICIAIDELRKILPNKSSKDVVMALDTINEGRHFGFAVFQA